MRSPPSLLLLSLLCHWSAAETWTRVTLYDVLQEDCRSDVADKDLGDPAGDAYFNIKDVYLPLACAACKHDPRGCKHDASTFDCSNPESHGNLVVRKVEVDVLLPFGTYNLCNVPAASCSYSCEAYSREAVAGVGRQDVCGGDYHKCDMAPQPYPGYNTQKWDYWNFNTAVLMGKLEGVGGMKSMEGTSRPMGNGSWFSLESRYENKYWRNASITKAINAECQRNWLQQTVQDKGKECFNKCKTRGNVTDPCWIGCFFETTLGSGSGNSMNPRGGMLPSEITGAWLKGFESDNISQGGCPPCPESGPCPPPKEMLGMLPALMRRVSPRAYLP